jgi:hypothetical protein
MMRMAAVVGVLVVVACSGGGTPAATPSPKPGARPSGGDRTPAPTATPHGGAILYRPTARANYAIERRDSLTLDLQGGSQVQQFSRTAYLTVSIAEGSTSGYQTTIRLDSLRQKEGGTVSADSVLRAEGTTWTGTLTPQGRLGDLKADRGSGVADQVGASLGVLFPVLPAAGLQGATTWSDTAERVLKTDAFDAKERAVTSYRLVKQDGRVYVLDAATGFQRTGTGGQAGQPMEMTSQGTRKTTYQFGADGLVAGAEGADSAEMTISVPAVGQTVPVHQRARWKISKQ